MGFYRDHWRGLVIWLGLMAVTGMVVMLMMAIMTATAAIFVVMVVFIIHGCGSPVGDSRWLPKYGGQSVGPH